MNNTTKIAAITLGCKVNQYETDAMCQLLVEAGYELVSPREKADIYIVNTCSVTNMADRKSRQMLHRAKKQNPEAIVAAVGCYVQAAGEKLLEDPYIDLIIGNNKKKDVVSILDRYITEQSQNACMINIAETREYEEMQTAAAGGHTRAYVKVQDGCNQFCSYCIIPYTRGRIRSRSIGEVKKEVEALTAGGYREIVITGIHVSSYGKDLEGEVTLLDLIHAITPVEGLKRIRLSSLEPGIITPAFVEALRSNPKLCPHFHLSLQSGCDTTLKRMNRRYSTAEYEEKCLLLREVFDRPALTTDVIVGFPGETEEEFSATADYLERLRLYEMHIFKFSARRGTRAEKMDGQVPEPVKAARSSRLLQMSQRHKEEYAGQFLGETVQVLAEEEVSIKGNRYWVGHTGNYLRTAFQAEGDYTNTFAELRLKEMLDGNTLLGSLS